MRTAMGTNCAEAGQRNSWRHAAAWRRNACIRKRPQI